MAVRLNTIKYPIGFGAVADVATVTTSYVGITSMYIAENTGIGVTFVSALLYITWQDTSTVTGGTISEYQTHVTLSGGTTNIYKDLNDLTNTGENTGAIIGPIDYTSYFNSNFGVTTVKGCALSVFFEISTGTGTASRGIYGWFDLTYAYDDSVANRTKTISVPYESLTGALPTNASTQFAQLFPLGLGGWLDGYPDIQIRNNFAHLYGNVCANNNATDVTISYNVTPGITTVALPTRECALASDSFQLYQLDFSNVTLGVANTIYIYSNTATRYHNIALDQFVTFTHSGVGVTQILNYLEIPMYFLSNPPTLTFAQMADRVWQTIIIPESNVTSRAVAVNLIYSSGTSSAVTLQMGGQTVATYTQAATQVSGQFCVQHLGDTRSRAGVGTTIVQGYNTFEVYLNKTSGSQYTVNGTLKLLYNSSPPSSIDNSSKNISSLYRVIGFATTQDHILNATPFYPFGTTIDGGTNYYYNHSFFIKHNVLMATTIGWFEASARLNSSEPTPFKWIYSPSFSFAGDSELASITFPFILDFDKYFNENKIGIASLRYWRLFASSGCRWGGTFNLAYHNIKSTLSGSISGSSGGQIKISAIDAKFNTVIGTSIITGNGSYSVNVHNPVGKYYVVASEGDTLNGISTIIALPGGGFNIALVPTMPINAGYYG